MEPEEPEPMMHPFPESGIEGAETALLDPEGSFKEVQPDAPVVGYTVKELIARMEGKLDAYAKRQDVINENVTRLVPQVEDHEKRLKSLELKDLAKGAVVAWRTAYWKAGVAVLGAAAAFSVIWQALHHP